MNCPKCQSANPAHARFCMKCGAPLMRNVPPPAPAPVQPVAPSTYSAPTAPKSKPWIWGLVILLLLAAGAAGLTASGILRLNTAPASGITRVEAPARGPAITKIEKAGEKPEISPEMPADVRAWLEHLERIEKERQQLTMNQIGSFMVTMTTMQMGGAMDALKDLVGGGETDMSSMGDVMTDEGAKPPTTSRIHEEVQKARSDWQSLRAKFDQLAPPAECATAAANYTKAMVETSGMMVDLMSEVERSMDSADAEAQKAIVGKLQNMKGLSKVIDEAGKATDAEVQAICDKYKTKKWFSIAGDIGGEGGMLRGMGGF